MIVVCYLFLTLAKYYPLKSVAVSKFLSVITISGISALLLLQGCSRGKNIDYGPDSWNFSISGDLYVGDTLKFQSTAPDNSLFQWTFGDGNSSTQAQPRHVFYSIPYNSGGIISDTVTLVVNNDIYHAVVKPINLKPAVPRISKNWSWTGGYFKKYGNCCPTITDHTLNDTTFAISKVDDYTINVWGVSLPFLADSNYFSNVKARPPYNATYVIYKPDTLFFLQSSGDSAGGVMVSYFHKF